MEEGDLKGVGRDRQSEAVDGGDGAVEDLLPGRPVVGVGRVVGAVPI